MPTSLEEFLAHQGVVLGKPSKLEEFFAHYGVPGMKWGQRKRRGGSGGGKASSSTKVVRPQAKHLSDEELRSHISRLKLEKEYKQLTTPAPSAGRKFVNEVLSGAGKTVATKFAAEYGTKAVAMAIAKASAKAAVKAL